MKNKNVVINCKNFELIISYFVRPANAKTILFLHGLGCAKDDYYGACENKNLKNYTLVGLDFPGCGHSSYPTNARFGIDDLVEITKQVIDRLNLDQVVLFGHSMGGLVGLLLAEKYAGKIESFINLEGNLAGSDCFFSGKVAGLGRNEFINKAFEKYIHRVRINKNIGLKEHAKILQKYSSAAAMRDVCPSLVEYSEKGDLLKRFLNLRQPIQFIYGSQNSSLPYLDRLKDSQCQVDEISNSGHFPFYENPSEFYKKLNNI